MRAPLAFISLCCAGEPSVRGLILVDTSVRVDSLRRGDPGQVALPERGAAVATDPEAMQFIGRHALPRQGRRPNGEAARILAE